MSSNTETNEAEVPSERKTKYPKSIFVILANEFCERFAYYGLRTILTLYLHHRLFFSENKSTMLYHTFKLLVYATPVFGAIIADSFLGKFRTILYLSILYVCGFITLSIGGYPHNLNTMIIISSVGLVLIACGAGGIKPCISAFGGDQFQGGQEDLLARFFSVFYVAINLGSLISTFLAPMLREDVGCFGEKTCYPLAFGVPTALMIVALVLFICGKPLYIIRPPKENIVIRVASCICHAISKKCTTSEKKSHWLDYADDKYDKTLIEDIKIILKIFVLYIPLPMFWALFDQKASRWTIQATKMDGQFSGFRIKADQMQITNPFLIIVFIPLFQYAIYPLFDKLHILRTSLQKITAGGILTGLSFIVAGLLELSLEATYPALPKSGNSQLTIINNSPCNIGITGTDIPPISAFKTSMVPEIKLGKINDWILIPEKCKARTPTDFSFASNASIESMMITLQNDSLKIMKGNDTKDKSTDGEPLVRIFYNIDPPKNKDVSFVIEGEGDEKFFIHTGTQEEFGMTDYVHLHSGRTFVHVETREGEFFTIYFSFHRGIKRYRIKLLHNETDVGRTLLAGKEFKLGGVYIVYIYQKSGGPTKVTTYHMVKENDLIILLQIPQYILITAGEIMFAITGLEFSYSQSPKSMKTIVQAAWLLTVAVGNLIIIVIAELHLFHKNSYEFFLFAAMMIVDMAIFTVLAHFYKYVTIKIPIPEKREAMNIIVLEE